MFSLLSCIRAALIQYFVPEVPELSNKLYLLEKVVETVRIDAQTTKTQFEMFQTRQEFKLLAVKLEEAKEKKAVNDSSVPVDDRIAWCVGPVHCCDVHSRSIVRDARSIED